MTVSQLQISLSNVERIGLQLKNNILRKGAKSLRIGSFRQGRAIYVYFRPDRALEDVDVGRELVNGLSGRSQVYL